MANNRGLMAPMAMMNVPQLNPYLTAPFGVPEPQIPYPKIPETYVEKKPKRRRQEHKADHKEELLKDIALEIYTRWKMRKLREKYDKESRDHMIRGEEVTPFIQETAERKIEKRWKKESSEVTRLFYKAAMLEHAMLGDDEMLTRKKKKEAKIKEECHPYLLFCKEHREELGNRYSGKEVLTMLSDMWKKLEPHEKDRYAEKAKRNKRLQADAPTDGVEQMTMDMRPEEQMPQQVYYRNDGYI